LRVVEVIDDRHELLREHLALRARAVAVEHPLHLRVT